MTNLPDINKLLEYFWPHPYPQSHPPVQVMFSNGLPESSNDTIHKYFEVPYSLFEKSIAQLLLEANQTAIRNLLDTGLYAEKVSYLHPQTPLNLNWPIITKPVYIVPASAVSDLAKPDFYNNKSVANPLKKPKSNNQKEKI